MSAVLVLNKVVLVLASIGETTMASTSTGETPEYEYDNSDDLQALEQRVALSS